MADGACIPVQGISEGRRESVAPIKASPRLPFLTQGVSMRCSQTSVRPQAPRSLAHVTLTSPRLNSVLSDGKDTPFHPPLFTTCLKGVLWQLPSFPLWLLLLTQTLEDQRLWQLSSAVWGTDVTKREQFVSAERQ